VIWIRRLSRIMRAAGVLTGIQLAWSRGGDREKC